MAHSRKKNNINKVMIVDDDKEFLGELKTTLELSGYDVTDVSSSEKVLDKVRDLKPHVILLDLKMSPMNGFQIAEELKYYPDTSHIPIIAMTAYFTTDEHIKLLNICGVDMYLKKPFNPIDMISRIENIL